jgi:hypothetical protein
MLTVPFYRGGNSLTPLPHEVRVDPVSGLLRATHGVSVWSKPNGLQRFGGAYKITQVPEELAIIQRGKNPDHYEIVPAYPITMDDYEKALAKVVLVPV